MTVLGCCHNVCSVCFDAALGTGTGPPPGTNNCGWTPQSGTWSQSSTAWTCTSSPGILLNSVPTPDYHQIFGCITSSPPLYCTANVYVGWVDGSNHIRLDLATDGAGESCLKAYKVAGGSDELIQTRQLSVPYGNEAGDIQIGWYVLLSDHFLYVQVGSNSANPLIDHYFPYNDMGGLAAVGCNFGTNVFQLVGETGLGVYPHTIGSPCPAMFEYCGGIWNGCFNDGKGCGVSQISGTWTLGDNQGDTSGHGTCLAAGLSTGDANASLLMTHRMPDYRATGNFDSSTGFLFAVQDGDPSTWVAGDQIRWYFNCPADGVSGDYVQYVVDGYNQIDFIVRTSFPPWGVSFFGHFELYIGGNLVKSNDILPAPICGGALAFGTLPNVEIVVATDHIRVSANAIGVWTTVLYYQESYAGGGSPFWGFGCGTLNSGNLVTFGVGYSVPGGANSLSHSIDTAPQNTFSVGGPYPQKCNRADQNWGTCDGGLNPNVTLTISFDGVACNNCDTGFPCLSFNGGGANSSFCVYDVFYAYPLGDGPWEKYAAYLPDAGFAGAGYHGYLFVWAGWRSEILGDPTHANFVVTLSINGWEGWLFTTTLPVDYFCGDPGAFAPFDIVGATGSTSGGGVPFCDFSSATCHVTAGCVYPTTTSIPTCPDCTTVFDAAIAAGSIPSQILCCDATLLASGAVAMSPHCPIVFQEDSDCHTCNLVCTGPDGSDTAPPWTWQVDTVVIAGVTYYFCGCKGNSPPGMCVADTITVGPNSGQHGWFVEGGDCHTVGGVASGQVSGGEPNEATGYCMEPDAQGLDGICKFTDCGCPEGLAEKIIVPDKQLVLPSERKPCCGQARAEARAELLAEQAAERMRRRGKT